MTSVPVFCQFIVPRRLLILLMGLVSVECPRLTFDPLFSLCWSENPGVCALFILMGPSLSYHPYFFPSPSASEASNSGRSSPKFGPVRLFHPGWKALFSGRLEAVASARACFFGSRPRPPAPVPSRFACWRCLVTATCRLHLPRLKDTIFPLLQPPYTPKKIYKSQIIFFSKKYEILRSNKSKQSVNIYLKQKSARVPTVPQVEVVPLDLATRVLVLDNPEILDHEELAEQGAYIIRNARGDVGDCHRLQNTRNP